MESEHQELCINKCLVWSLGLVTKDRNIRSNSYLGSYKTNPELHKPIKDVLPIDLTAVQLLAFDPSQEKLMFNIEFDISTSYSPISKIRHDYGYKSFEINLNVRNVLIIGN